MSVPDTATPLSMEAAAVLDCLLALGGQRVSSDALCDGTEIPYGRVRRAMYELVLLRFAVWETPEHLRLNALVTRAEWGLS